MMNSLLPIFNNSWLSHREPAGSSLFDGFFGDFGLPDVSDWEKEWTPAIDVSETEKEYIVKAELPGINKKDIDKTIITWKPGTALFAEACDCLMTPRWKRSTRPIPTACSR